MRCVTLRCAGRWSRRIAADCRATCRPRCERVPSRPCRRRTHGTRASAGIVRQRRGPRGRGGRTIRRRHAPRCATSACARRCGGDVAAGGLDGVLIAAPSTLHLSLVSADRRGRPADPVRKAVRHHGGSGARGSGDRRASQGEVAGRVLASLRAGVAAPASAHRRRRIGRAVFPRLLSVGRRAAVRAVRRRQRRHLRRYGRARVRPDPLAQRPGIRAPGHRSRVGHRRTGKRPGAVHAVGRQHRAGLARPTLSDRRCLSRRGIRHARRRGLPVPVAARRRTLCSSMRCDVRRKRSPHGCAAARPPARRPPMRSRHWRRPNRRRGEHDSATRHQSDHLDQRRHAGTRRRHSARDVSRRDARGRLQRHRTRRQVPPHIGGTAADPGRGII